MKKKKADMQVLYMPADETLPVEIRTVPGNDRLRSLQKMVGGYIEAIPTGHNAIAIYANEDGRIYNLPVNRRATELWKRLIDEADFLVGNIIVFGGYDAHGNSRSVSKAGKEMVGV